jgi:hypothetical protein
MKSFIWFNSFFFYFWNFFRFEWRHARIIGKRWTFSNRNLSFSHSLHNFVKTSWNFSEKLIFYTLNSILIYYIFLFDKAPLTDTLHLCTVNFIHPFYSKKYRIYFSKKNLFNQLLWMQHFDSDDMQKCFLKIWSPVKLLGAAWNAAAGTPC